MTNIGEFGHSISACLKINISTNSKLLLRNLWIMTITLVAAVIIIVPTSSLLSLFYFAIHVRYFADTSTSGRSLKSRFRKCVTDHKMSQFNTLRCYIFMNFKNYPIKIWYNFFSKRRIFSTCTSTGKILICQQGDIFKKYDVRIHCKENALHLRLQHSIEIHGCIGPDIKYDKTMLLILDDGCGKSCQVNACCKQNDLLSHEY